MSWRSRHKRDECDDITLHLLHEERSTPQVLAPVIPDHIEYHVFFLHAPSERDWVTSLMTRLEAGSLGFRCGCHHREPLTCFSQPQAALYGIKNSSKTAVILSRSFLDACWPDLEHFFCDMEPAVLHKDVIPLLVEECVLPEVFVNVPYINVNCQGWWTSLLARLALPDEVTISPDVVIDMTSSLVSLHSGLQRICLLVSLKSRCGWCAQEKIDLSAMPEELMQSGVRIPEDEYMEVIRELMEGSRFRCHVWCYNLPLAFALFTALLLLCLLLVPLVETRLVYGGRQTGGEFVHGGIVWLCLLVVYMVANHISRVKMKKQTYRSLSKVNTFFIKYNVLVGVEKLGIADCNKYYLHFFYFELGSCLDYIQELIINQDEETLLADPDVPDGQPDGQPDEDLGEMGADTSDHIAVLERTNITNNSVQNRAEDLILKHSGSYLNLLINKKLDNPEKQRHLQGSYCPCQYVEQKVFKIIL